MEETGRRSKADLCGGGEIHWWKKESSVNSGGPNDHLPALGLIK